MLDLEPAAPSPLYVSPFPVLLKFNLTLQQQTMQDDLGAALMDLGTPTQNVRPIQYSALKDKWARYTKGSKVSKAPKRWEAPTSEPEERRTKKTSRRHDPLGKTARSRGVDTTKSRKVDTDLERYSSQAEDMLQEIFFGIGLSDISSKVMSWEPFA